MAKNKYLECGKIINTHGVSGEVKLESWCDSPNELASLKHIFVKNGDTMSEYKILRASCFKRFVIARLSGVDDMDSALALKNVVVYADRKDIKLSEGSHFIADMIGLDVIDAESGHIYGRLSDVINRGASDIYVIDTDTGEKMMPAVPEFVKTVDIEKGIFITPIEGMFD